MKILNISAECYPAAKAGGLGDVLGALPKYLNLLGTETAVIIPKYHTKWILSQSFERVFVGTIRMHDQRVPFAIEREVSGKLGFPLFVANIPGRFDRAGVYAAPEGHYYADEVERYLSFQLAVLEWLKHLPREQRPQILHCHDHHSGLIPFFIKHTFEYKDLAYIPTIFTIHNGQYHGAFSWHKAHLLPFFEAKYRGLIDWANTICPLASAIKCCWRFTTVSPNYLNELRHDSNGMEWLISHEWQKAYGILNGIDADTWNPKTDPMISSPLDDNNNISTYKAENKKAVQARFRIHEDLPIFTFIGRLVSEKGADLLPRVIERFLYEGHKAAFIVLGTGIPQLMERFVAMRDHFFHFFDTSLEYNEQLAHQLYAGSDFLLMPSRVEPCGLNQLYAFRYGTIPIVRAVGGLRDTVIDMGERDGSGRGLRFLHFTEEDMLHALRRAMILYYDEDAFTQLRHNIMQLDFSWQRSATTYQALYKEVFDKR